MKTLDWLNNSIISNGLLCDRYISKVRRAKSKKQLFEICCDANGISFLMEMRDKGFPLDYDTIVGEFGNYINGAYKPSYEGRNGYCYTSSIYCNLYRKEDVSIDCTVTAFLNCKLNVVIPDCAMAKLYVDHNSELDIICMDDTFNVYVEVYGDGIVNVVNGVDKVKIKRK